MTKNMRGTNQTFGSWCPECGPGVALDEDGLCTGCGVTCMGPGATQAWKEKSRADAAEARVRELEAMVADHGRERDAAQEAAGSAERRLREFKAQLQHEREGAEDLERDLDKEITKRRELEAQCAAMREALKGVAVEPCAGCVCRDVACECDCSDHLMYESARAALSGDASRAMLDRVEALERDLAEKSERCSRGAHALIESIGSDGPEHIDETCARAARRLEALELVAYAARKFCDSDALDILFRKEALSNTMRALDALEAKR